MQLIELMRLQAQFDEEHHSSEPFYVRIDRRNPAELEHLLVGLFGELGEFANELKKVVRGDFSYDDARARMEEELVDAFIYMMKIAHQADFNLEDGYLRKLETNKVRFAKWRRKTNESPD